MKKQDTRAAKLAAVKVLRDADHLFLSAEGVDKITAPFGYTGWAFSHRANPQDPKGLTFHDGSEEKVGMGADHIATKLCDTLGLDYPDMFGRGSRLRACCDVLEAHLKETR